MALVTVLFLSVFHFGQNYSSLQTQAAALAETADYEELLLKSSEMILLEPLKPEGYYYSAVGLFAQTAFDKASENADKAYLYGEASWKTKATALLEKIKLAKEIIPVPVNVNDIQSLSAEQWKNFWEIDKKNITAGINAIELYNNQGRKLDAYKIISDSSFDAVPGAAALRKKIQGDSNVSTFRKEAQLNQEIQRNISDRKYEAALRQIRELLKTDTSPELKRKLAEVQEEKYWYDASGANTVPAYEKYLKNSVLKKHESKAKANINDFLRDQILRFAKMGDVASAEADYSHFLTAYSPAEDFVTETTTAMAKMYRDEIYAIGDSKNKDDKAKILRYLKQLQRIDVLSEKEKKMLRKLE